MYTNKLSKPAPHHNHLRDFTPRPYSLVAFSEHVPHVLHTRNLQVRECLIALIDGVIHVVMDGIEITGLLLSRAALLLRVGGTAVSRGHLDWGVIDVVARTSAGVALEGMQQTEPVTGLVHGSLTLVEAIHETVWHGVGIDVAPIVGVCGWILAVGTQSRGESASAQHTASQVGLEKDVERIVAALTKRLLHVGIIVAFAYSPCVVGGPCHILQLELDIVWIVGLVQGIKLSLWHGVGNRVFGSVGHDNMEDGLDLDRVVTGGDLGSASGEATFPFAIVKLLQGIQV